MSKREPLNDREIVSKLSSYIREAMNYDSGDASDTRQDNYNRYVGKPYGNERTGYSKVVTREVFEAVEWAKPSILRVFTSGDRVVSFEPRGPEDEKEADQETDLANHFIHDKADGFLAIHDWVTSALIDPNSYLKVDMEDRERSEVREYTGLSRYGLQKVLTRFGDDIEILEQDSYNIEPPEQNNALQQAQAQVQAPPQQAPQVGQGAPQGAPQQAPQIDLQAFDIKIRVRNTDKCLSLAPLPPEQVLIEKGFSGHNLDEANFVCHRSRQTYTDLVELGIEPDTLSRIGLDLEGEISSEEDNRLYFEEEDDEESVDADDPLRKFWVHECFVRLDVDGDGLAERRRILLVGNEVVENDEDDYQPIVCLSSILIPHRHIGLSVADTVKDLQLISTTLRRQLLDNIYRMNVRKKYVGRRFLEDGGITIDALLDPLTEIVPANDPTQIIPEQIQPIIADLLPVIQDLDNTKQVRTGIAPNLSLDPEVLQQSTMGAFTQSLEQASQRIETIVRVFAETGFRQLMLKVHRLLRTNIQRAVAFKLRGEWTEVDPSAWLDRPNVKVNVGLGFHNKESKVQLLMQLLQVQKEGMAAGLADHKGLYQTLDELVEAAGLGTAKKYFLDPSAPGWQPPQPQQDPMAAAAMEQLKIEGGKLQKDMQKLQSDVSIEVQKLQGYLGEIQARIGLIEQDTKLKEAQTAEVWARIGGMQVDQQLRGRDADRADAKEERERTRTAFDVASGIRGAKVEDDDRERSRVVEDDERRYTRASEFEDRERSREVEDRDFELRSKQPNGESE